MKHYFNTTFEVFDLNDEKIERQYFVTSKWILQEDIVVVDVGNSLLHDKSRMEERLKFVNSINTHSKEFLECSKLFDDFLSEQFSQVVERGNEHLYKLSGSYCSLLFSEGVKGILYSSIGSNGAGLNVALHTSLIDEGVLLPQIALFGCKYNRYGEYTEDYSMKATIDNKILR